MTWSPRALSILDNKIHRGQWKIIIQGQASPYAPLVLIQYLAAVTAFFTVGKYIRLKYKLYWQIIGPAAPTCTETTYSEGDVKLPCCTGKSLLEHTHAHAHNQLC